MSFDLMPILLALARDLVELSPEKLAEWKRLMVKLRAVDP